MTYCKEKTRGFMDGVSPLMYIELISEIDEDEDGSYSTTRTLRIIDEITGINHVRISCCINSCIAYTGEKYSNLKMCPHCHEPRFDHRNISRQTFDYIPITHRMR